MKKLSTIFSIESVLVICIIVIIFLLPSIVVISIKATYGYLHTRNAVYAEGQIKSLSKSYIDINGIDKRFNLENVCTCKLTKQRIDSATYASLMFLNKEGNNEVVALKLNDKYIFNDIERYKTNFSNAAGLAIILFFVILILIPTAKLMGKKAERNRVKLIKCAEELAPKVNHLRKPALRLVKSTTKHLSKFGGKPLVEENGFTWPTNHGKPLAFLAQINLAELAEQYNFDWLPKTGTLLFFYDVCNMPWGYDPKHKTSWKVIYFQHPTYTADFPNNIDKKSIISEFFIASQCVNLLPPLDKADVEPIGLSDEELDAYIELQCETEPNPLHQVGGFASPVQEDMEEQAQLTSHGIYTGGAYDPNNKQISALQSGVDNWKLLLQIDSDDDLNFMWGDLGMIYFWVEADKAKQGNFEDVWLFLQCT